MGHIVPGPSKIKIPPLSQQSSSDADISARVLEKFGFLCAFVYAVWLNFIDPIYGYLAGDGSLPVGVGARPSPWIGESGLGRRCGHESDGCQDAPRTFERSSGPLPEASMT